MAKSQAKGKRPPLGARRPSQKEESGFARWATEWVKSIVVAVIIFLVIRTLLVQTFTITSGSMIPTLLVDDWLMISKVTYGPKLPFSDRHLPGIRGPRLGDVVVFRPPHEPDLDVVKRIVGMGGDTLAMKAGQLYRNGKPAVEPFVIHTDPGHDATHPWMVWQKRYLAPGVDPATYQPTRDNWGPIVVPPGRLFVMGDNRDDSLDSRFWGFLDPKKLEGNVLFIYYSFDPDSPRPLPALAAIRWGRIGKVIR